MSCSPGQLGLGEQLGIRCGEDDKITHRVGILDLPPDIQLVPTQGRHHRLSVDHVIVLLLAEELIIPFHDMVEAGAQEVHVLGLHDMAKRVLVFGPGDTAFSHGAGIVPHGLEGGKGAGTEGCIRIGVGMWAWSASM